MEPMKSLKLTNVELDFRGTFFQEFFGTFNFNFCRDRIKSILYFLVITSILSELYV